MAFAAEFPPATRVDWQRLAERALKGAPFEQLQSKTYDGIAIDPLPPRYAVALPIAGRAAATPWDVVQRVDHPDPAAANAQALHDLDNGATALTLVFAGSVGAYGYGLPSNADALARALDGIDLEAIAIELDIPAGTKDAVNHLAELVRQRRLAPDKLSIRFGLDPIGAAALIGGAPLPWRKRTPRFAAHVCELAEQGFRRALTVTDGRIVHNAGGSEAQELAFVIAIALAYVRALEAAGVNLDAARGMTAFRLSADADQFLTMAKFRALRKLWARIEQACGLEPKPVFIAAETAWRMMSRRDPHVNMLRTTIAAAAAGLGGADAVTVLPFTAALGLPDRFARRVARNAQLILLQESNLAKVADPGAGAGTIEMLTSELCTAAWSLFQEIEAAGGGAAALEAGLIQRKIAEVRTRHMHAVATRKDPIIGTSEFPNLGEAPVELLDVAAPQAPSAAIQLRFPEPLSPIRLAEPYERLRDASDRTLAATGARPKIFLANLGTQAEFTTRSGFAKNFFEAGGIEAAIYVPSSLSGEGSAEFAAMIAAFKGSGSRLACLCSSNEVYTREAVAAAQALAAAGAKHIYLAGRPGDLEPGLRRAGVETFIFAGCDALATLKAAHANLGLTPKGHEQ